jgi:hypothetical protein
VEPGSEGNVLVNRHREGRNFLEDHADAAAQPPEVYERSDDVFAIQQHRPGRVLARIHAVDTIEDTQESGLPAARRADKAGDLMFRDCQANVLERLRPAVKEVQMLNRDLRPVQLPVTTMRHDELRTLVRPGLQQAKVTQWRAHARFFQNGFLGLQLCTNWLQDAGEDFAEVS